MEKVELYVRQFADLGILYLPKLIIGLLTLMIGWWIIDRLAKIAYHAMIKLDVSLRTFLTSVVRLALRVILLITVAGMVGFETTSLIAILGAASLAVGLALQGTLANFAGGVLLLIFKPYVVGDVIEALGKTGKVKEIQIFNTILVTGQGETVILPNGAVSNGTIVNVTTEGRALVQIETEVDATTDLTELRSLLVPLALLDSRIMKEPAPSVGIASLKGGMTIAFKAYTEPGFKDAVTGDMTEQIRLTLAKHGVKGPVPVTHTYVHNVPAINAQPLN